MKENKFYIYKTSQPTLDMPSVWVSGSAHSWFRLSVSVRALTWCPRVRFGPVHAVPRGRVLLQIPGWVKHQRTRLQENSESVWTMWREPDILLLQSPLYLDVLFLFILQGVGMVTVIFQTPCGMRSLILKFENLTTIDLGGSVEFADFFLSFCEVICMLFLSPDWTQRISSVV